MASKQLSPALKALLVAPHARGLPVPAPRAIDTLFRAIEESASSHGVGHSAWLALSVATLTTINSPESLCALYHYAVKPFAGASDRDRIAASVERASTMREAGLKTISFSGIARTINNLGALRNTLEPEVAQALVTEPQRRLSASNVSEVVEQRSLSLWRSIYEPHASKLVSKLSSYHPDLPVHILQSHYGPLLSDPPATAAGVHHRPGKIGRVLTSIVGIAALRAMQGVEPQVKSHVYGLRNASSEKEVIPVDGHEFLTSDEGCIWVLDQVDRIVHMVSAGQREQQSTTSRESKL